MRIALGIEYDGTAYNGWQRQNTGLGVQQRLEEALYKVADHPVDVTCAGRTDTGVHARGQVVHFDTPSARDDRGWLLGVNSNLPDDICVTWARHVDDKFHARFSASGRNYRYRILNRLERSALYRHRAWWVYLPLDAGRGDYLRSRKRSHKRQPQHRNDYARFPALVWRHDRDTTTGLHSPGF